MPHNYIFRQSMLDQAIKALDRHAVLERMSTENVEWCHDVVKRYKCDAEGCTRASVSRGMCHGHYSRWRRGVSINGHPIQSKPGRQSDTPELKRLHPYDASVETIIEREDKSS